MKKNKAVTLLELLMAIVLFSIIVLGFSSIESFSRFHVVSSQRRVRMQNEVAVALDHMTKQISMAIGDVTNVTVDTNNIASRPGIRVVIDSDGDGLRGTIPPDRRIAYRFNNNNQIEYFSTYVNPGSTSEILATHISACAFTYALGNNFVDIDITACWDPDGAPFACNTPDNPSVRMQTRIKMPSVSVN